MKLLIVTQKIDINDPVLGFFHRWVEKISKKCEKLTVICLEKGEYHLPANVKVFSLGKELNVKCQLSIVCKIKYIFNFYKLIWQLRNDYNFTFIHMNQEYVLLGWKLWRLLGKKIFLWRNHQKGNVLTNLAVFLSDKVFCTSDFSYTARFKKTEIMPVGIDTAIFKNNQGKKIKNSILCLGRLSPVKRIEFLIKAGTILDNKGVDFKMSIIGSPITEEDFEYENKLKILADNLIKKEKIVFREGVKNEDVPEIYCQNEIIVNLTPTGSFDKTIVEAMACESIVVVSNKIFDKILLPQFIFKENNSEDLAEKLISIINSSASERFGYGLKFRQYVVENHSLDKLIINLEKSFVK